MSKSKKKIAEVARAYMNDLVKRFPGLEQDLELDDPPGVTMLGSESLFPMFGKTR
jgi:hypothetical protein